MRFFFVVVLVALTPLFMACDDGDGDGGETEGSCTYLEDYGADTETVCQYPFDETGCTDEGGSWSEQNCPDRGFPTECTGDMSGVWLGAGLDCSQLQ